MSALLIAFALILAALIYFGIPFGVRALAHIPFRWTNNPANTFALVVTHTNDPKVQNTGGNIVDILHAISGKKLVRNSDDPLNWYFKKGSDPDHDNFLYQRLGVQDMGSIFYTLRTNIDKRMRFSREKGKPAEDLHSVTKVEEAKHVFFSGDLTVVIKKADTKDNVYLDFEIDFIFERKFPARSIVRLGDAPAFLTSLVEQLVNNETVSRSVLDYWGGPDAKVNRENLAKHIDENPGFKAKILKQLGLDIKSVSVRQVDIDPDYKALYSLDTEAEKKGEADVIAAEKAKQVTIKNAEGEAEAKNLLTAADKKRLNEVIVPAAKDERTLAAFQTDRTAEAYAKNTTVTTYAPGKETVGALPLSR